MRINPNNPTLQPALGNTTIGQGVDSSLNKIMGVSFSQLNKAMSDADQAHAFKERTAILANMEKDKLNYAKQEYQIQTKQIALDYVGKITAIDAQIRQEEQRRDSAVFNVGATLGLNSQLTELAQRIRSEVPADGAGYAERYNKEALQLINSLSDQAPNEEARLQFGFKAAEMLAAGTAAALSEQRGMRMNNRKNILSQSVEQLQVGVLQNASEESLTNAAVELNNIFSTLDMTDFTQAERDAFKQTAIKGLQESYINGLIGQMSPDSLNKAGEFIESEFAKIASPQEYMSALNGFEKASKEYNKMALERSTVIAGQQLIFGNAAVATPESKKAGDQMFAQQGVQALINQDINGLAKTFNMVGAHMGPQTNNIIKNSLYGRDPNVAVTMANSMRIAAEQNRNFLNAAAPEDIAFANRLVSLTSFGFKPEEALQQLLIEKDMPKQKQEDLKAQLTTKLNDWSLDGTYSAKLDTHVRALAESAIDSRASFFSTGISQSDITAEDAMEMKSLYETVWAKNNGNADLANEEFKVRVKKTFAPSDFSATSYMRNAPEIFFTEEGAIDEIKEAINPSINEVIKQFVPMSQLMTEGRPVYIDGKKITNEMELKGNLLNRTFSYMTESGETRELKVGLRPIHGLTGKQSSDPLKGIVKSYHIYDELTNLPLVVNGEIPTITIDSGKLNSYNKYRETDAQLIEAYSLKQKADVAVSQRANDLRLKELVKMEDKPKTSFGNFTVKPNSDKAAFINRFKGTE